MPAWGNGPRSAFNIALANSGSNFYRIPGVIATQAGTLLAVCDRRVGTAADLPNMIDKLILRSTNSGLTWTSIVVFTHSGTTASTATSMSDASLVQDPSTGRIFLFCTYGPPGIGSTSCDNSTSATSTTTLHIKYMFSDDDGASWSALVDVTPTVKTSSMFGFFVTSGHGWADSTGMYQVFVYTTASGSSGWQIAVLGSTDHGATWSNVSGLVKTAVNESHLVHLSDGSWLVSCRPNSAGVRSLVTAASLAGPWTQVSTLPDPGCNGDLIRVDPDNSSIRARWLLASGCASAATRCNLTIWLSQDNGATWPFARQVYGGGAAYSSLVVAPDGTVGVFWEDTDSDQLMFNSFMLNVLAAS